MTTRIYRSTDAGAPQLGTSAGGLAIILKACLVTGYGSKDAAGWSVEWEGVNQIVLKMGAGSSGMLLAVDDSIEARYAYVNGCKAFTSFTDMVEKFPVNTSQPTYKNAWYKRYSTSTSYGQWVIIASESFVYYFQAMTTLSTQMANNFFGDYECVDPNWEFNTAITGRLASSHTSSISSYIHEPLFSNNTNSKFIRRSWSGMESGQNNYSLSDKYTQLTAQGYGVNPLSGKINLYDYEMFNNNALMGKLPNAYVMLYPYGSSSRPVFPFGGVTVDGINSPTGKPMFVMGGSSYQWLFLEYDV